MSLPSWRIDRDLLSVLVLILMLAYPLMIYNPCTAAPLKSFCSPPNYEPNSTFESNLKLLLSYLPSNTSPTGFYNTSVGIDSDQGVYGLTLCGGDVTPQVCKDCIETASQEIFTACPHNEDAVIWYESCQLRYKYQDFLGMMVYAGKYPDWNGQQPNISNPDQLNEILKDLLIELSSRASSNSSRFATGEANVPRIGKVHGLVQCTRDIDSKECEKCLSNAKGDLMGCCSSRRGGMILDSSCNLRFNVSTVKGNGKKTSMVVIVICVSIFILAILGTFYAYYRWGRKGRQKEEGRKQHSLLRNLGAPISTVLWERNTQEENQMDSLELPLIDFETIKVATNNFSDSNKLGQGGFGIVYKGTLPDGNEIAVKRLSRKSWQGLGEFKNEVILIAKLQHRNLVRLLGCGIKGAEKLLIYEFMPNTSLDVFIFDPIRRSQLDWNTRYSIIGGIARGLLYLHEDSRLKIIHRDLKPSNVLLDHDMIAKISDFGMARLFCDNQNTANTRRIVGTYGYMSPEYAMEGLFSVKSDVFSFGVILLEILSGEKNSGFYHTEHAQSLLSYAWRLWVESKGLDFVDPLLIDECSKEEVLKCIHIGLLCVQEDAADRPTMSSVVVMLESGSITLPQPTKPAFALGRVAVQRDQSSTDICSVNAVTISCVSPR